MRSGGEAKQMSLDEGEEGFRCGKDEKCVPPKCFSLKPLEYLLKLSILSRHFYDTVSSEKATAGTDSSSVPVLGYYCMPLISLDPNHQLLAFPHTRTHARALLTFPSLALPCRL